MKIVFASNFFNHHEKFFCDEMYKLTKGDFYFIQTEPMTEERINLGWGIDIAKIPYCVCSYQSNDSFAHSMKLINECDALIIGSAVNSFIMERIGNNKLSFFYSESSFKKGFWHFFIPHTFFSLLNRYILPSRKSNVYMLCASAFTAIDTYRIHAFRGKCFTWGHFVDIDTNITYESLLKKKESLKSKHQISILWAGRLIGLKHPEYAVMAASTLRDKAIPFHLTIIGSGPLETEIKKLILSNNLEENVTMLGAMSSKDVREYMDQSDIFLFTSGKMEGWGASLNEAMSSGCAVVADSAIGSAPFLIEHTKNGLLYKSGSYTSFEDKVLKLATSKELRVELGQAAYTSIRANWSPYIAASRLYNLIESLLKNNPLPIYDIGPISKAPIINRNWFKE